MQAPVEIILKNVSQKEKIEAVIYDKLTKLEQVCGQITSCNIFVEENPTRQKTIFSYSVRIAIKMPPHNEIVVKRESGRNVHNQLGSVLRDAFLAARRQVEQIVDRNKQYVKAHTKAKMTPKKLRQAAQED